MNKQLGAVACLMLVSVVLACDAMKKETQVDAISYRIQTGLLGLTYSAEFRRTGEAKLSCTFYDLGSEDSPRMNTGSVCDSLYATHKGTFVKSGNSLEAEFAARVEAADMDAMKRILDEKGYFRMTEGWEFEGKLDAPPSFVDVEFEGKKRSVGSRDENGEAFFEIIQELESTTKELKWSPK